LAAGVLSAAKRRLPPAWRETGAGCRPLTDHALRVVTAYRHASRSAWLGGIAAERNRRGRRSRVRKARRQAPSELRACAGARGRARRGRWLGAARSELSRCNACDCAFGPMPRLSPKTARARECSGLFERFSGGFPRLLRAVTAQPSRRGSARAGHVPADFTPLPGVRTGERAARDRRPDGEGPRARRGGAAKNKTIRHFWDGSGMVVYKRQRPHRPA
jgi:hypothetical protein